jgi:hypothetical protein
MIWAMSSGKRRHIKEIAVAGAFIAISTATLSIPANAAPGLGGTPNAPAVLPAPPPADPPTIAPQPPPPPPPPAPAVSQQEAEDWWPYAGTGSF